MRSFKAKKIKKFNGKSLIVAFDAGKKVHYGYFRAPDGTEVDPFKVYNTKRDFDTFWYAGGLHKAIKKGTKFITKTSGFGLSSTKVGG